MKRTFLYAIMVFLVLSPIACGHDHSSSPTVYRSFILSDPAFDGDIAVNTAGTSTITQDSTQSVFAGIDPATNVEYRAFLDFPLGGSGGIPGNVAIDSATLDIVITNIFLQSPGITIPIRIELVSIPRLTLNPDDFSRTLQPALAFTTIEPPISSADVGYHVSVDVTALLREAQRLGLADFQIRILEDLGVVSPGLIEINDTTGANRQDLAPILLVTYF